MYYSHVVADGLRLTDRRDLTTNMDAASAAAAAAAALALFVAQHASSPRFLMQKYCNNPADIFFCTAVELLM